MLLGANGAGKTTTLRAHLPDDRHEGRASLRGQGARRACSTERVVRRGIAHVPQGRGTFPELTVSENLEAGAYIRKDRAEVRDRHRPVVRDVPPPARAARRSRPAASSGGEQQMLARRPGADAAAQAAAARRAVARPGPDHHPGAVPPARRAEQGGRHHDVRRRAERQPGPVQSPHRAYVLEAGEIVLSGPPTSYATTTTCARPTWGSDAADPRCRSRSSTTASSTGRYIGQLLVERPEERRHLRGHGPHGGHHLQDHRPPQLRPGRDGRPRRLPRSTSSPSSTDGHTWAAIILAVGLSMALGAAMERTLIRPIERRQRPRRRHHHARRVPHPQLAERRRSGARPQLTPVTPFPRGPTDQYVIAEGPPRFAITYGTIGIWIVLGVVVVALVVLLPEDQARPRLPGRGRQPGVEPCWSACRSVAC